MFINTHRIILLIAMSNCNQMQRALPSPTRPTHHPHRAGVGWPGGEEGDPFSSIKRLANENE